MRKITIFIFLTLTTTLRVSGQIALKLNLHSQYESFEYSNIRDTTLTKVKDGYDLSILPSPTISLYRENGNFQEICLSRILFIVDDNKTAYYYSNGSSKIIDGSKETTFAIGLRYDYNFLLTNGDNPFSFFIGLSSSPTYYYQLNEPKSPSSFNRSKIKASVYVSIVPRIIWKINPKIFMDLNIPFNVYELSYKWRRINNPSLPLDQQSNGKWYSYFISKTYEIRLGVGFMF